MILFLYSFLQLLFRRFNSGSSSNDECTMYFDRNVINRRNVREDPHTAYRPNRDFLLILEVTARVVAAAYDVLAISSESTQPKNLPIPDDLTNWHSLEKLQFLHKVAALLVDQLVAKEMMDKAIQNVISAQERQTLIDQVELNADGRCPCRFPGCSKRAARTMNSDMTPQ